MKFFLILGTLFLLLFSCKEQSKPTEETFGPEIAIKHTMRNPMIDAWWPDSPFLIDSVLVLASGKLGEDFVRFFSLKDFQEIGKFGQIGRGPGEFLAPDPFPSDDSTFYIHDLNRFKVFKFDLKRYKDTLLINQLCTKEYTYRDNDIRRSYKSICRINENYYAGLCYHARDSFFVLLDSNFCFLRYFGNSPIREEVNNAHEQLTGECKAYNGMIVYATGNLPYIACYMMKDSIPVKLWEENYDEVFYGVRNDQVLFNKQKTRGNMINLYISSRYIYVASNNFLLSERDAEKRPETCSADRIFVFDWEGRHMGVLKPDVRVKRICVSNDDKTLYAILNQPDYAIATFELPEWKKEGYPLKNN